MFLDKSKIKSSVFLLLLEGVFLSWPSKIEKEGIIGAETSLQLSCLPTPALITYHCLSSSTLLLLFHDHHYVSLLHAQPQHHLRKKQKIGEGMDSEKWIPSSDVGGRGMANVTLGFRVFWCAFFGIMIGHFQVWLDMLSSPFPIPPTDPVTHVLHPLAKLPLRTLSC